MFLIPCNGESPLTTGTCFDYNACILHLQKVKQQNIKKKKTVVVFNLLRIHVQKLLLKYYLDNHAHHLHDFDYVWNVTSYIQLKGYTWHDSKKGQDTQQM